MPKMQVYLPDDLYRQIKRHGDALNVSGVLQAALREALAELERREALTEIVREYEAELGPFTDAELDARIARDRALAIQPKKRRKQRSTAA